jgi:hypothetical protein
MRGGLARVCGKVRPAGMPSREVAPPLRIRRGHGGLVPAAELLIRLARVEDQPGDLVRDGQDIHHAGFLGFPGVAQRRHVAVTVSLRPGGVNRHHTVRVICPLRRAKQRNHTNRATRVHPPWPEAGIQGGSKGRATVRTDLPR